MFERFTQEAKAVLVEAQDVVIELGVGYISPGHILYGCAEGRESTAGEPLRTAGITADSIRRLLPRADKQPAEDVDADVLRAIGIDFEGVRAIVEETFGTGALKSAPDRRANATNVHRPPFTPEAKRSLELSLRVALELHDRRIRPGHLLLGLLRLDNDFISIVVQQSDASVAGLSAAVLESVDDGSHRKSGK
jgi:ATP-dependent Clp protease ATP-binding subunit ClpA